METTSHFIGIKIKHTYFVNLFTLLQQYLKKNNAEHVITLQTMQSLHLTLYYFENEIPPKDLIQIKNTSVSLNEKYKNFVITVDNMSYFQKDNADTLCYLNPVYQKQLHMLHDQLAKEYRRDFIPDNQYPYVPHISLFRVTDTNLFKQHKDAIENIVQESLVALTNENLFAGFALFEVDSHVTPELQLPITP
ncbi:MAG TPA: 2'-5' RNA ligase family protein [Candidatus Saccharimonadales bacterium]|nr:2'-5' RNA ligase family protein [Candidatus Saccharimonadales bacterium]